ncbi:hypothetical protein MM239_14370 [Belliella sp. DSM 111904]|uniref:Uncharacterized protein n=1 Tax=Belliella filtrata TaxID=2923435 RepID=A0ABS9V304_9BACT|nr:hypothetical protein [Belliella filtrata]MCH7410589.1 hypothetical protein [Belliella filtrata]
MNRKEKLIYKSILILQGSYYMLLGIFTLVVIRKFNFDSLHHDADLFINLIAAIILTIGFTLFAALKEQSVHLSLIILGLATAFSLLLFDTGLFQPGVYYKIIAFDFLLELIFILLWIWLFYEKWISIKFKEMKLKLKKSS